MRNFERFGWFVVVCALTVATVFAHVRLNDVEYLLDVATSRDVEAVSRGYLDNVEAVLGERLSSLAAEVETLRHAADIAAGQRLVANRLLAEAADRLAAAAAETPTSVAAARY